MISPILYLQFVCNRFNSVTYRSTTSLPWLVRGITHPGRAHARLNWMGSNCLFAQEETSRSTSGAAQKRNHGSQLGMIYIPLGPLCLPHQELALRVQYSGLMLVSLPPRKVGLSDSPQTQGEISYEVRFSA